MKWKWCTFNGGTPSGQFYNLCYSNGIWMAGNVSGAGVYRSIDGKTWIFCNGTSGFNINSLYGANGIWVASGDEPWYSTDNGGTWTGCIGAPYFEAFLYNANGIWVGAGGSGIVYSSDGKQWLVSNIKSGIVNNIYFANGIFIASMNDGLRWSTDCKTWTSCTVNTTSGTAGKWYAVENHNGIWVALNAATGAYYSMDGKTWVQSNYTTGYCYKLAYGSGKWAFTNTSSSSTKGVWYSTDGKNWVQSDFPEACTCIHYNNNLWIGATSYSGVYYSYDAKHWVRCYTTGGHIIQICSANGISVARLNQNGLAYSPTWEPTIPAGEYMFSTTPGSPALNPTELGDVTLTETINFVSNNETYSTMTAKHIHS